MSIPWWWGTVHWVCTCLFFQSDHALSVCFFCWSTFTLFVNAYAHTWLRCGCDLRVDCPFNWHMKLYKWPTSVFMCYLFLQCQTQSYCERHQLSMLDYIALVAVLQQFCSEIESYFYRRHVHLTRSGRCSIVTRRKLPLVRVSFHWERLLQPDALNWILFLCISACKNVHIFIALINVHQSTAWLDCRH